MASFQVTWGRNVKRLRWLLLSVCRVMGWNIREKTNFLSQFVKICPTFRGISFSCLIFLLLYCLHLHKLEDCTCHCVRFLCVLSTSYISAMTHRDLFRIWNHLFNSCLIQTTRFKKYICICRSVYIRGRKKDNTTTGEESLVGWCYISLIEKEKREKEKLMRMFASVEKRERKK